MSIHVRSVLTAIAILFVAMPDRPSAAQDVKLGYRWTKGEELRYRITQETKGKVSGLPNGMGEMNVDMSIAQVVRTAVQDVAADGTTTMRQTFESIRMVMSSPMGEIRYDSDAKEPTNAGAPAADIFKAIIGPMIGESFTLVLAPTGNVVKVEGMGAIMDKVLKTMPPTPGGADFLNNLKAGFSDEGLRNAYAQMFNVFPDRPVKRGDSWPVQISISNPMAGAFVIAGQSTLKDVQGGSDAQVATITSSLTIKGDTSKPAPANPMGLTIKFADSAGDGEVLFDITHGRLQRGTTHMTLDMAMSGAAPDGTQIAMRNVAASTITIELMPR